MNKSKAILRVLEPYLFLLPALIVFIMFTFYPFFKTIYLSLNLTDAAGVVKKFVGFRNYATTFASPSFWNSLVVSGQLALLVVVPTIVIGLCLAIMANSKMKGMGVFKTIYALPMAISSATAAFIWMFLLHPSLGLVNYVLHMDIGWLTDPKWALLAVVSVTIWLNTGMNYIYCISGLQSIPEELYESAEIDGANVFAKHWYITVPSVSHVLFFLMIINAINTFQVFGQINILTVGGPGEATNVLVYAIYQGAFFSGRFGIASAQSFILFIILLILTLLQFKFGEKRVNY